MEGCVPATGGAFSLLATFLFAAYGNLNCPDNRSLSSAKVVFVWTIIVIFYMCLRDIVAVEVLPKSSVKQIIMH
jgi:hypothetical protein